MAEKRLLIVDDDRSILTALRMVLAGDYAVLTAETGSQALGLLREKAPDLILLDVGLPDRNGIDLFKQIKSLTPDVKIIMISATEETKMISAALDLGAVDYLIKPVDAQDLKTAIQKAFQKEELKPHH